MKGHKIGILMGWVGEKDRMDRRVGKGLRRVRRTWRSK
jgi:hypothetical protein